MYSISDTQVAPKIKIKKNGQKLKNTRVNYAKNIFLIHLNTFPFDFPWIDKDCLRTFLGFLLQILANPCESKENPRKMYSNGLRNILKII